MFIFFGEIIFELTLATNALKQDIRGVAIK